MWRGWYVDMITICIGVWIVYIKIGKLRDNKYSVCDDMYLYTRLTIVIIILTDPAVYDGRSPLYTPYVFHSVTRLSVLGVGFVKRGTAPGVRVLCIIYNLVASE